MNEVKSTLLTPAVVRLSEIKLLPGNPKNHDLDFIDQRMQDRGYIHRLILNKRNMHCLHGNGRTKTMLRRHAAGGEPYDGIDKAEDGDWLLDIDYMDVPEDREMAVAIELNEAQERGGWDEEKLAIAIGSLPEGEAEKTGFAPESVSALRSWYGQGEEDPEEWDDIIREAGSGIPTTTEEGEDVEAEAEEASEEVEVGSTKRPNLSVLRYTVRTSVAKVFREALKVAMKEEHVHDPDQAIELVAKEFLAAYGEES